jgi:hypothetical protein
LVIDLRAVSEVCDEAVALLAGVASRQSAERKRLTVVVAQDSVVEECLRRSPTLVQSAVTAHEVPDWVALSQRAAGGTGA